MAENWVVRQLRPQHLPAHKDDWDWGGGSDQPGAPRVREVSRTRARPEVASLKTEGKIVEDAGRKAQEQGELKTEVEGAMHQHR